MMKRVLITERQLQRIIEFETVQNRMVGNIVNYLKSYYEPVMGVYPDEQAYHSSGLIKNLVDNATLSPRALKDHLKYKFGEELSDEFYEQVISDWFNKKLDNNEILSKPIKM